MIFGYAGTFGEPQVFEALVGRPVPHEQKMVGGIELIYQDTRRFGNYRVRTLLDRNWKGMHFYGAFGLRPREGAQTKVTFYEVVDDLVDEVTGKLKNWDMHACRWFEMTNVQGIVDGIAVTFVTEKLLGRHTEPVPRGFETDIWYRRFVNEMTLRLQLVYGPIEGQMGTRVERV